MITPAMNRKRTVIPTDSSWNVILKANRYENRNMNAIVSQQWTSLRVAANDMFLPVVMAFVEQSSLALGLGKPEALKMTLASEELFLHLCRVIIPNLGMINIRCTCKGHVVQSDFSFQETRLNMHAFNLTASLKPLESADLDDMRLILASRSVDRLKIRRKRNLLEISLIKEKKYPHALASHKKLDSFTCKDYVILCPTAEELKYFALLTRSFYEENEIPHFFQYPGMLADMIQSGGYHAIIARGPAGEIGGGIVWHLLSDKTVEAIGPFVLEDSCSNRPVLNILAASLIEACISEAGRTSAIAMICCPPESGQYHEYFEYLGHMSRYTANGVPVQRASWFRMMHEDVGAVVWTTKELEDFLRQTYRRLFLPREIRMVGDDGESLHAHSVLSTQMDRLRYQVDLDILWPGADIEDNLLRHLHLFQKEGIRNMVFEIDSGVAWKSAIIPCLLRNGFQPVHILPYAGDGDVILFQLLHPTS